MKVLIVEDQPDAREDIAEELGIAVPSADLVFASSRDSALEKLDSSSFDLIVCDLRIPAVDGSLDAQVDHGLAVHARAREACAGVPLVFFTGRGTVQNMAQALSTGGMVDLFGAGDEALVTIYEKSRMLDFVEKVAKMDRQHTALASMAVVGTEVLAPEVADMVNRALRIYGRRKGASSADVQVLTGLSGSAVARALFRSSGGAVVASVFLKVGDWRRIEDERRRYSKFVSGTLSLQTFAPDAGSVLHNLRNKAAIFYHLAEGYESSLFDMLGQSPGKALHVLASVQRALAPWHSNQVAVNVLGWRSSEDANQRREVCRAWGGPCFRARTGSHHVDAEHERAAWGPPCGQYAR